MQVSADSQDALDEACELLAGGDNCPRLSGHSMEQLLPPVDPT